jgi:hypothetical protein
MNLVFRHTQLSTASSAARRTKNPSRRASFRTEFTIPADAVERAVEQPTDVGFAVVPEARLAVRERRHVQAPRAMPPHARGTRAPTLSADRLGRV